MKFFKITSFIIFICLIFVYGIGIGTYKWFPYEQVRSLKWFLTSDNRIQSNDEISEKSLNIKKRDLKELLDLREEVLEIIVPIKEIT